MEIEKSGSIDRLVGYCKCRDKSLEMAQVTTLFRPFLPLCHAIYITSKVSTRQYTINLPKSNVLELLLGDKGSVIARPSGTEPKVKFYYTAVGENKDSAKALLDAMVKQMSN